MHELQRAERLALLAFGDARAAFGLALEDLLLQEEARAWAREGHVQVLFDPRHLETIAAALAGDAVLRRKASAPHPIPVHLLVADVLLTQLVPEHLRPVLDATYRGMLDC